jgi:hypothetical protein
LLRNLSPPDIDEVDTMAVRPGDGGDVTATGCETVAEDEDDEQIL